MGVERNLIWHNKQKYVDVVLHSVQNIFNLKSINALLIIKDSQKINMKQM